MKRIKIRKLLITRSFYLDLGKKGVI